MPPLELPNLTDTQKTYDAMRTNLISINTAVNQIQEDLKGQERRVGHLEEIVITGDGNKELSHAERIRLLEAFTNDIKDTLKYWGRLIGGALLLNFLGFMTGVIVAIIKFLPVLERIARTP